MCPTSIGSRALARYALCGGLLWFASCGKEPPEVQAPDPVCLSAAVVQAGILACTNDAMCPAGSVCGQDGKLCDVGESCRCVVEPFATGTPDLLIRGFSAAELELQQVSSDGSQFEWTVPPAATAVVCGLFVDDPQVAASGLRPEKDLGRIQNANKALYRSHAFKILDGSNDKSAVVIFALSDLSTAVPASSCGSFVPFESSAATGPYPIVTTLEVGCWAYDSERVIAASQLRNVRLADLNEVKAPVADCAAVEDDDPEGRFCLPQVDVGRCAAGKCKAKPSSGAASGAAGAQNDLAELPIDHCTAATDDAPCSLAADFKFGRCVADRCVGSGQDTLPLPLIVDGCDLPGRDTDFLNCFDDDVQGFGTCYNLNCRPRCVLDSDCAPFVQLSVSQTELSCAKLNRSHDLTCGGGNPGDLSYIGVCVPKEAAPCK